MNDLIERYVWAVAHDLPKGMRNDVARELRATIEDTIDARGTDDDETVRDVLIELGDPSELAAGYAGKRRYLIGPALYPAYRRLLTTLLLIVVPIVLVATLVEGLWRQGESPGPGLLTALNASLQTGVMVVFWVTLVCFLIERSGAGQARARGTAGGAWRPDALPPVAEKRTITLAETVVSLAMLTLLVAWIPWQRAHSVFHVDGEPVPFLAQGLWDAWIPLFIAIVAASMGVEVWKYVSGRWTLPLVVVNVVVNAVFAVFVVALLRTQEVVGAAFLWAYEERAGTAFPGDIVGTVVLLVILGICLWDSVECVLNYLRVRRGRGAGQSLAGVT